MSPAQQHTDEGSNASWRQDSELENMADLPKKLQDELTKLEEQFWISGSKLKGIVQKFQEELDEGLSKNGANIPMNVTWVHSLPTGKEQGTILTLDLGGTNLRVCKVELHGEKGTSEERSTLDQEQYKLPDDLKTNDAETLWEFIASKVEDFIKNRHLSDVYNAENPMPLGFTFSYPATQERIDHAILQTWTKGFDISGVEGADVAQQLRSKLEEKKLPVELICVINDTVGAMIASAYNDPDTIIGAIFGTGCNAAYMASLHDIKKLDPNDERITSVRVSDTAHRKMAVNCEYGAFDNAHAVLPRTKYDKTIDASSPRPGEQTFEKLSAGLYLGEIFRLILVDLYERGFVFSSNTSPSFSPSPSPSSPPQKNIPETLTTPYALDTAFLSALENSSSPTDLTSLFNSTLHLTPSPTDILLTQRLAILIATRGARLCACGIAALCLKEGIDRGHVAADGSVANKHPRFKQRWVRAMGEIMGWDEDQEEGKIQITSAEDGSGVGCAIIAAMELERRKMGGGK